MSLDTRGRAATIELEDAVRGLVPPMSDVRRRARRRHGARVGALVAMTAVILGGGLVLAGWPTATSQGPATTPTPTATSASFGLACRLTGVTCADGRIRIASQLQVPLSFVPAAGVNTDDITPTARMVMLRLPSADGLSAMTVLEQPVAVDPRGRPVTGMTSATAEAQATWLAARPFVQPTTPQPVMLGDLQAWRVDVALRPGAALPEYADGTPIGLTFQNKGPNSMSTGVDQQLDRTYYYLVDVPRHGLVVVWICTWDGRQQDLDALDAMAATLRFG